MPVSDRQGPVRPTGPENPPTDAATVSHNHRSVVTASAPLPPPSCGSSSGHIRGAPVESSSRHRLTAPMSTMRGRIHVRSPVAATLDFTSMTVHQRVARSVLATISSQDRSLAADSTCVESLRARPVLSSPFPSAAARIPSSTRHPASGIRSGQAVTELRQHRDVEPGSPSSSPRAYFQSIRARTASTACRSVIPSTNCNTETSASRPRDQAGFPASVTDPRTTTTSVSKTTTRPWRPTSPQPPNSPAAPMRVGGRPGSFACVHSSSMPNSSRKAAAAGVRLSRPQTTYSARAGASVTSIVAIPDRPAT